MLRQKPPSGRSRSDDPDTRRGSELVMARKVAGLGGTGRAVRSGSSSHSTGGVMRNSIIAAAAAIALTLATSAQAQLTKTIPGERKTVTATVESIEQSSRQVQVKMQDGSYDVITVPYGMKRFDTLKVGDKTTATYYENVVLQLRPPDTAHVNTSSAAIKKAPDGQSAVTGSVQRTITA